MSRAAALAANGLRACTVVEIDLPACANTYGVAPCTAAGAAGSECYNGIATCQDRANYTATVRTVSFVNRGTAPPAGETIRPYILSEEVAPTELSTDKGLATRGKVTLKFADEPAADDLDPYAATRATPAAGTYWRRLIARTPNLAGATARVRRGYVVTPWDWATFETTTLIVEAVAGPGRTGVVTLTLADTIKTLDRAMIPAAVDGLLAADFMAYSHVGFATGGAAGHILLAAEASAEDDTYIGHEARITGNTGAGQRRTITDYIGAERRAVVSPDWSVPPDATSSYEISPLSLTLESGQGAQYPDPATSGKREYIRVKDEVIEYTAKSGDVLSWASSANRAQFGTERLYPDASRAGGVMQAAKRGDAVVLCRAWVDAAPADALQEILNEGGLPDANIDLAGLATEAADWLALGTTLTACIPSPEKASALFADLCVDLGLLTWWDGVQAKQRFKADRPEFPTDVEARDQSLQGWQSVDHEYAAAERITRHVTRFALRSPVAKKDTPSEYLAHAYAIDVDAEADVEYGDQRPQERLSRWMQPANALHVRAQGQRLLRARRDAPGHYSAKLHMRDAVAIGALIDITCDQVTDATGAPVPVRCRVTYVKDDGGWQQIRAVSTRYAERYIWFAPDAAPDFSVATDADKAYFYFCDDDGLMPDGSAGYRFS